MSFHAFIYFVHLQCYMQIRKFKWFCLSFTMNITIIQLLEAVPQCNLLNIIFSKRMTCEQYKIFIYTRIYGHLWWPFFSSFGYGKLLELVSICNSPDNLEGMTIFGRNDKNLEGMTKIRKECQ